MAYELIITEHYRNLEIKFLRTHKNLASTYIKTLTLLKTNPHYPSLRLHKLNGKLSEFYSISINMKYRIVIDFIIQDDKIMLIDVGDHSIYNK